MADSTVRDIFAALDIAIGIAKANPGMTVAEAAALDAAIDRVLEVNRRSARTADRPDGRDPFVWPGHPRHCRGNGVLCAPNVICDCRTGGLRWNPDACDVED